jgi:hypothetical protein
MGGDTGVAGARERVAGVTPSSRASGPVLGRIDRAAPPAARPSGGERVSGAVAREPGSGALRWLLLGALVLAGVTVLGAEYYFAPVAARVRSPLHPWLRPSGYVGQTAGIVAFLILLTLWLYPLRRRFRSLAFLGAMARWLDVHVALALLLPLLAAVHAGWQFRGLIGLGYWSMLAVWLSGLVGRYLYVRIPRGRTGLELDAEEAAKLRRTLVAEIARRAHLPPAEVESILGDDPWPCEGMGILATLRQLVADDVARWRATRRLARACGRRVDRRTLRRIARLARREMALMQQARLLGATQRLLRLWHVAHRPFAIAALAAVLVHVAVAVAMGATWLR